MRMEKRDRLKSLSGLELQQLVHHGSGLGGPAAPHGGASEGLSLEEGASAGS